MANSLKQILKGVQKRASLNIGSVLFCASAEWVHLVGANLELVGRTRSQTLHSDQSAPRYSRGGVPNGFAAVCAQQNLGGCVEWVRTRPERKGEAERRLGYTKDFRVMNCDAVSRHGVNIAAACCSVAYRFVKTKFFSRSASTSFV